MFAGLCFKRRSGFGRRYLFSQRRFAGNEAFGKFS